MTDKTRKVLMIIFWILLGLLLIIAIWFVFFRTRINWKIINQLIAEDAKKYVDPIGVEKILLQGCKDLVRDRERLSQAKVYAKANHLAIEKVIEDSAVKAAIDLGLIAAPSPAVDAPPGPANPNGNNSNAQ